MGAALVELPLEALVKRERERGRELRAELERTDPLKPKLLGDAAIDVVEMLPPWVV